MNKKIIFFFISLFFIFPYFSFARENVNYWYIKDFQTEIRLNKDSSAIITEYIIADCGNAINKHGIFRVLETQINTGEKIIQTPIELISITDFYDKPYKYTTINDSLKHTITWKIGNPNITVKDTNYYKIQYKVYNVIYNQENFDEFYFNILGNFWDMEIDNFSAKIFLPTEINQQDLQIFYYTGPQGSKSNDLATYNWSNNILIFNSIGTIPKNNGITISLSVPKNIFLSYTGELVKENYSSRFNLFYVFLIFSLIILPILSIIFCIIVWKKYGEDPQYTRTVIAEYDIPDNLDPILFGTLLKQGKLKNNFITAAIINFAVKKIINIEQTKKHNILFKNTDYVLHRLNNKSAEESLSSIERQLLFKLFDSEKDVSLSSLKYNFNKDVIVLKKNAKEKLIELGYVEKNGFKWQIILVILALVSFAFGIILSGIIFLLFSIIMPKKTKKGMDVFWKIKGLKLYMDTAEKDRQRFYEKENIFEKLLPYAIVFGMTELWINKMKIIYTDKQLNSIVPAWYIGNNIVNSNMNSFLQNFNSFTSSLNGVISSISSSTHSTSGFGGGGFSGGGAGGGGGGGW